MGMTEPPALLQALADRAATGKVDDLKVYYFESTRIAGNTILCYELLDRIRPYCMFITAVERALIKRGMEDGGRKVVNYVPSNFSQSARVLTEHVGIETFLVTVSPRDRHGYFTFGTGSDYSSKVARSARHLGSTEATWDQSTSVSSDRCSQDAVAMHMERSAPTPSPALERIPHIEPHFVAS
jgi:itaconate CoA-transferase